MKVSVVLPLLIPLVTVSVGPVDAQLPPGSVMTVGTAHSHSVSIPLDQMTVCPGPTTLASPAPKAKPGKSALSGPIVSFEGLHLGELNGGGCSLPQSASDDSGAVGFDHYVQVVNTAIVVYDKSGSLLAGPVSTTTFWANQPDCGGNQIWTDSVVRFDRHANRWVVSRPGTLP